MAGEIRERVYRDPAAQQQDEARAAAAGWVVTGRSSMPDGVHVMYQFDDWKQPVGSHFVEQSGVGGGVKQGFGFGMGCLLLMGVLLVLGFVACSGAFHR